MRAPSEKWAEFSDKLRLNCESAANEISDSSKPLETRYTNWYGGAVQLARQTIGKTTLKVNRGSKPTIEMKSLQQQKKSLKDEIQSEKNQEEKQRLLTKYKEIQEKATECKVNEKY